jgi:hypothetical protein
MTAQLLQFIELSAQDREEAGRLKELRATDLVELRIRREGGSDESLPLPPSAVALLKSVLGQLAMGERVAILTEEQELSPSDAAEILGMSRPLVVHRMDIGDLPFRYIGKHRRTKLKDVLNFKTHIDAQRAALSALAADADDLAERYGV